MKPSRKVYDLRDAVALLAEWEREDADLEAILLTEADEPAPVRDAEWTFPELDVAEGF